MIASAIDFTFAWVAGPDTLMSNVRVLAARSAWSEMTEYGCALERVGAGAAPQPASTNRHSAMTAVLIIHDTSRTENHCVTPYRASQPQQPQCFAKASINVP